MRIPMIVRAPGQQQSGHRDQLIESIDIYPTLCDLTGLDVPDHVAGQSFASVLKHPQASHKPAAVGRFVRGDTIRTDGYRYSEYTDGKGELTGRMLYDHKSDPGETVNIVANDSLKEDVGHLHADLHSKMGKPSPPQQKKTKKQ